MLATHHTLKGLGFRGPTEGFAAFVSDVSGISILQDVLDLAGLWLTIVDFVWHFEVLGLWGLLGLLLTKSTMLLGMWEGL